MRHRYPLGPLPAPVPATAHAQVLTIVRLVVITSFVAMTLFVPLRMGDALQVEVADAAGPHSYREGELLVRFKTRISESEVIARLACDGVVSARRFRVASRPESPNNRLFLLRLAGGRSVADTAKDLAAREEIELVQPNYIHHKTQVPDDPYFGAQWAHENTGIFDPAPGLRGPDPRVAGVDMKTLEAYAAIAANGWTADEIIVGVIDTGVDHTHEDLADIIWVNPGETAGNGYDDDGNGKIDDVHGWDYLGDDNDPMDEDGHGTHVAGIIAAVSNNSIGVSGTATNVKIMPLRFLGPSGGSTADAIDAINYAVAEGARVLNNSWGGSGYEPALETAIEDAYAAGALFVAAAGNDGTDNDITPHYPSDYEVPNVISVAASNPWGHLADFSNYGAQSVDIAAPGDEILSTTPPLFGSLPSPELNYGYDHDFPGWEGYVPWGGTSMATPYVAGGVAWLYGLGAELWPSTWPTMTPEEKVVAVRDHLLARTEPYPDLHERVSTAGHLNLLNLVEVDSTPPESVSDLQAINVGPGFVTLRFTATGDDGSDGRANYYDLRYDETASWTTFEDAIPVRGGWQPHDPGMWDYVTATGLEPATDYRFQLRVIDNAGNASDVSAPVFVTSEATTESFSDDMETGIGGWTTESNDPVEWQRTTAQARSPSHSWTDSNGDDYPDNLDSSLVSPVIDLTTSGAARLDFWQMYDLQDGFDYGYVQATANGIDWRTLLTVTGTNLAWTRASLDLTGYAGGTVQIRFHIQTDHSIRRDGWYIDDVVVHSTMPAPEAVIFDDPFDTADNWDPGAGDWGLEAGRLSDSPGGDYPGNNVSSARLIHPLHLETMEAVVVSFDFAAIDYEDGYDFLYLQLSTDGERWRSLRRWTGTAPAHREGLDLSEYAGYPEIWLRFLLSTNASTEQDGVSIDDLLIETISMPDGDSDGVVDLFDCAPADGGSYAPPTEIQNLRWQADGTRLEWDSDAPNCGPGVVYDVLRGELDEMPLGSGGAGEICLEDSTSDNFIDEFSIPDPGQGLCYLVRGTNACAVGTWGMDSTGLERSSSSCP